MKLKYQKNTESRSHTMTLFFGNCVLRVHLENFFFFHTKGIQIVVKKLTVKEKKNHRCANIFLWNQNLFEPSHVLHSLSDGLLCMQIIIVPLVWVHSFPFGCGDALGTKYVFGLVRPLSTSVFAVLMFTAELPAPGQVCFVHIYIFKIAASLRVTDVLNLWFWLQKEL